MDSTSLWFVWAVIGIIGGYMAGRLIPRARGTAVSICIGICGSLIGGCLTIISLGTNDKTEAISLLSAALGCGIFLWIMTRISPKRSDSD